MKTDLSDIILERKRIAAGFNIPLRHIPLVKTDVADHKCQVEKVYQGMLREADVIDECCWRFERIFGWNWN